MHVPRTVGAAFAFASVAWGSTAYAVAAPGADAPASTGRVVLLVLFVAAAYFAAHFLVDRLQRRFLVLAGLEYLLLGILLGPAVPQIRAFANLTPVLPGIALTAGWMGLLRGTELQVRRLGEMPEGTVRVVLVHHLVSGAVVALGAWLLLTESGWLNVPWPQVAISAGVLGCCGAADSAGPVDLLSRRYALGSTVAPLLRRTALFGDLLLVFLFGLLFCIFHRDDPAAMLSLRPTEWAVVSIALGLVLGLLFSALLAGDESPKRRFLALVGIITFASGAAWFLRLDPLLVNVVLGIVVVNTAKLGDRVHDTLQNTQRPMMLVLLVLAGALWRPPEPLPALLGLGAFVLLRLLGKVLGSLVAAWGTPLRRDLFRGLLAHGGITVAMAVSFRLVYQGPAVDLAYTIVLASVVLHDLAAPRVLRGLLVDAGDLHGEAPEPTKEAEVS